MSADARKSVTDPTPHHLPFLTLVLLLLMALYALQGPVRSWASGRYRAEADFRRALDILLDESAEPRPAPELVHGAVRGMVEALQDRHSVFLAPPAHQRLQEDEAGKYVGLGVQIRLHEGQVIIQAVFDGSPAAASGLRPGDTIVSAAEHDPQGLKDPVTHDLTRRKSSLEVSEILRGRPGSTVTLTVLRNGKSLEFTVERREIERPVVEHRLLADGIGFLRISDFPDRVSDRVKEALAALQGKPLRGVVIDLRRNNGGFLDEAVRVADLFIPGGVIVSTQNRNERDDRVYTASPGGPAEDLPLVVLVDGASASAAEVLAGALQDHGRARLVGVKTYGKGAVNKRFPLPDGSGILLTTGGYRLPKGRQIEGKGIEPDLVVQPPSSEELKKLKPGEQPPDPQLDAAVKLFLPLPASERATPPARPLQP